MQIHATLGPASLGASGVEDLIAAGADVIRLNLSHTRVADLPALVRRVHDASRSIERPVRIAADVRGRKLRIGPLLDEEVTLRAQQRYELICAPEETQQTGDAHRAWVNHPSLARGISTGASILLDDGALALRVESIVGDRIRCIVETGGLLPQRSGVNVPGRQLQVPALTPKDLADLDALAPLGIDELYMSYVESAQDIAQLRAACSSRSHMKALPIVAKIERAVALDHVEAIAVAADAVCLARGDLGVEIPLADIPFVQRRVVQQTHAAGRPFILAGEILYSLVTRHVPTRAELTDVAAAVEQDVDGYILSDETAIGVAPATAVRTLRALVTSMQQRAGI